jgi:hypothetical protein
MADNPRYSDLGIGYSGVPITPGVDMVGSRARASLANNVGALLDRMGETLYKKAADDAQREGLLWGAANPISIGQLEAAASAGEDPLATPGTYFGDAARKAQASVLLTNLSAKATAEMANVHALAETGQLDFPAAAERLDAITNGNAAALSQVDGEYGIKLKGALATHSASVYKQLTEIEIKRYAAGQKAEAERFLGDMPTVLETTFRAGDLDVPGVGKLTPDAQVALHRQMAARWAQITMDPKISDQFEKAVSAAKVGATTKLVSDKEFAATSTEALARMSAGNLGPMTGVWAGMTTEEHNKVRTQYMQASSFEYTAKERAERDDKDARGKEIATKVTEMYMPGTSAPRQRQLAREIATTNAMGIGGPVLEASTIKSMLKPDGDGAGSQGVVRAMEMIDRQGVTDLNEVVKRTGIKGGDIVKIQTHLYSKGDQHLNRQIKTMASIPDGIVQMNGDQQRRFDLLSQEAEILKARQIQEKGTYDPFLVVDDLRKRRDEITREKATDGAKARLENFKVKKGVVKLNLDTSAEEMRRMGMSEAEIANAQRIQREGMGK